MKRHCVKYITCIYNYYIVIFSAHYPSFPGTDASLDEFVKYYHQHMYTQAEIRAFLILRHGRDISKTRLRRIIRSLGLRRNNNEASNNEILDGIRKLLELGFTNAGYRVIWRLLNVSLRVRATQATVQRPIRQVDIEGVILRRGRRLRRRIYRNGGPNCIKTVWVFNPWCYRRANCCD